MLGEGFASLKSLSLYNGKMYTSWRAFDDCLVCTLYSINCFQSLPCSVFILLISSFSNKSDCFLLSTYTGKYKAENKKLRKENAALHKCVKQCNDVMGKAKIKLKALQIENENLKKKEAVLAAKYSETDMRLTQLLDGTKELKHRYEQAQKENQELRSQLEQIQTKQAELDNGSNCRDDDDESEDLDNEEGDDGDNEETEENDDESEEEQDEYDDDDPLNNRYEEQGLDDTDDHYKCKEDEDYTQNEYDPSALSSSSSADDDQPSLSQQVMPNLVGLADMLK